MTLDKIIGLASGDLVELRRGSTPMVGYFVRQDEHKVYLTSGWTRKGPTEFHQPQWYFKRGLDIEILKKRETTEDYSI